MFAKYDLSPGVHAGLAVSRALVAGVSSAVYNYVKLSLPAAAEVVAAEGVTYTPQTYPFLSDAGESVSIVSSSPADIAVDLTVLGLDAAGDPKLAVIRLAGTTPVTSAGWRRINSVANTGATPYVGDVSVSKTSGGSVLFVMRPGAQRSFCGVTTVARGKRAAIMRLINSMQKNGGSNTAIVVRIYTRAAGSGVFILGFASSMQRDGNGAPDFENEWPETLPPLTDFIITLESETAAASAFIRAAYVFTDDSAYA